MNVHSCDDRNAIETIITCVIETTM